MFAPAVTMIRPRAAPIAVLVRQLPRDAIEQRGQSGDILVLVGFRPRDRGTRGLGRFGRRPVVDDALAERDSARRLPEQGTDDRHDRRLDGVHPRRRDGGFVHVVQKGTAGLFLLMRVDAPGVGRRFSTVPRFVALVVSLCVGFALLLASGLTAAGTLLSPAQFIGFTVGSDNKLVRWDKIVEYMRLAAGASDRVRLRELGKTSGGNPFIALEISSPDTLQNLERYKQLERRLYFQGGAPSARERDEIFRSGKVVVLVTCSVHANEIGATQMALELVHRLATDDSPAVKKILDNVIFLLVPSANPDGQIMVTDWFNENLGTPFAASPLPSLYHQYAGHDTNRDMYMLTQKESQYMAELAWHDWFPSIWLDQHQMGTNGPRMFVMPAADPINPNVHPLIYRWNGILGQSQAAALEAAGKNGIIYNSVYTNFWQGALAWSGWWHNQIGLLTEVASARTATPIQQLGSGSAANGFAPNAGRGSAERGAVDEVLLPPPTDVTPRTEYPRPWMGGRWTLRDIVDYELIATMALLETAADRRETILRQIYEVNRQTVEGDRNAEAAAILIPVAPQHDAREAAHLADRLMRGGVEVYRAESGFEADGQPYGAGTFVIPMTQIFGRYAKDLLERQTYPEIRRNQNDPPEQPYDVTAWSLGMLFGIDVTFTKTPPPASLRMTRLTSPPEVRWPARGQRLAIHLRVFRRRHGDCDQPPAEEGSPRCLRRPVAGFGHRGIPRSDRSAGERVRARCHGRKPARGADRGGSGRRSLAPYAAHRAVRAMDRREHGRRVDALGPRAV